MTEIDVCRELVDLLVADTTELIAAGQIDGTEAVVILAHALAEVLAVANNDTDDLLTIWAGLSAHVADVIRDRPPPPPPPAAVFAA